MELRIAVAVVVVVVAAALARIIERRRRDPAPAPVGPTVPQHLRRDDFERPEAEWLVALFSSATCDSCATMKGKVAALESQAVATCDVEYSAARELHARYGIDSVPLVVVADRDGAVRAAFVGNTTATDLWAAVAEVRAPGSTPEHDLGGVGS
ncbi:MAG: hypothetical protein R3A49_06540 [Acidimicrobiia bacterium]